MSAGAELRDFASAGYWQARYAAGGNSGAGSANALARYKAALVNRFVACNRVESVVEFGCGDGSQLALLDLPRYLGLDVAPAALARCAARFAGRPGYAFRLLAPAAESPPAAELGLSLDVIYHLVEDAVFEAYIAALFAAATRFVIVYSSNVDLAWPAPHVRHRRFTDHVAHTRPDWRLMAHLPNPRPFDPARPDATSFADFFVYAAAGEGCMLTIPETGTD
jgi:hypothetical protein